MNAMPSRIRLQGTDGVRGVVCLSSHESVRDLSPQEAFLERGMITERFVELYCHCVVRCMMEWGVMDPGHEVVVGWDPRESGKALASKAADGISKAGGRALMGGMLPTPAVPLFMLYRRARLGLVITASHNPADQNGIKIFLPQLAMKPLHVEDDLISEAVLKTDPASLAGMEGKYEAEDVSRHAVKLFTDFCRQERNSWLENPVALSGLTLIVDPANGAYTGIASELFLRLGVGEVIQVNPSGEGPVNRGSGVTQFDGNRYIGADLMGSGGKDYSENRTVRSLFEAGRRKRREILAGEALVSAAVFDADGDRFYRIDYRPDEDGAFVLSGDEIASVQAEYLVQNHPDAYDGGLFITTVESDLNVLSFAQGLGLETALTGVGDKWILREIAESHLRGKAYGSQHNPRSALSYLKAIGDVYSDREAGKRPFCLSSEESGHNITVGWMEDVRGETLPLFIGNGLKSAVNSYAATASLRSRMSGREFWDHVREPFTPGFKETYYVHHSHRGKFRRGGPTWNELLSLLRQQVTRLLGGRCRVDKRRFTEEEDMLYLTIRTGDELRAAIFARNSGTEDKTSINIRGRIEDRELLSEVGHRGVAYLAAELKSDATPMGRASLRILRKLHEDGPQTESDLKREFQAIDIDRLLSEMLDKEKSLQTQGGALQLSPLGSEICKRRF
jgi:phosphomannomutase